MAHDTVTNMPASDAGTHCRDFPGKLHTCRNRVSGTQLLGLVDLAPVQASGANPDENLFRTDFGRRNFLYFNPAAFGAGDYANRFQN